MTRPRRNARTMAQQYLPHLDTKLVLGYAKRIITLLDKVDYGWLNEHNDKTRHTTERIKEHYDALRERKEASMLRKKGESVPVFFKPLSSLCQADIVDHLARKDTLFYVSSHRSGYLLACLDLDWKDRHKAEHGDANDTVACARFILMVLGLPTESVYQEPSTHGDGVHVYVLIDIKGHSKAAVNASCATVSAVLSARCKTEGFLCSFDDGLLGTFSLKDGSRGDMVKIPRPDTDERLTTLLNLKPVPFKVIHDLALQARHGLDFSDDELVPEQPFSDYYKGGKGGDETSPRSEAIATQILEEDAFTRTVKLCDRMNVKLNRAVSGTELLAEYNRVYANVAGPETRQRVRRCHQVAKNRAKTFRPNKPRKNPAHSLAQIVAELTARNIQALIAPNWKSKTSTLKVEDIALVLFLLRTARNEDGEAMLPKKYFLSASRNLKAEGKTTRSLDDKRIAAAKRILAQTGFITIQRKGNNLIGTSKFVVA